MASEIWKCVIYVDNKWGVFPIILRTIIISKKKTDEAIKSWLTLMDKGAIQKEVELIKKNLKKMFGLKLNRRMRFKTSSLQTK